MLRFGFGAKGGVTGRGGVEGAVERGLRRGVAWMSIGNAMKTSLPVGLSSDSDRLMELAELGAGATDDEVETGSGLVGAVACEPSGFLFLTTTSHRISLLSSRVSLHTTSTSYRPVTSRCDLRLDDTMPISPSSDSAADVEAEAVVLELGPRERPEVGVMGAAARSLGCGEPSDPPLAPACPGVPFDRRRPDGFRESHSAVMAGRGDGPRPGMGESRERGGTSAGRLFGMGRRGGERAVG